MGFRMHLKDSVVSPVPIMVISPNPNILPQTI